MLTQEDIAHGLNRHQSCDWGVVTAEDHQVNNQALARQRRVLSAYHALNGVKFWIITEADRSATTVLLPDEY